MSDGVMDDVCIANIGPKQRRMRLYFGLAAFVCAGILLAVLIAAGAPWWARLLTFLPATLGAIGFWQFKDST